MTQRPRNELEAMQQRLEQLLDRALQRDTTRMAIVARKWHPSVDAYETESKFVVLVDLAGMSKESIQISYEEPDLRISGTREHPYETGRIKLHQMEINHGPFERVIRIGVPVRADSIQAQYRDGFLLIDIPKSQNRATIKVQKEE